MSAMVGSWEREEVIGDAVYTVLQADLQMVGEVRGPIPRERGSSPAFLYRHSYANFLRHSHEIQMVTFFL